MLKKKTGVICFSILLMAIMVTGAKAAAEHSEQLTGFSSDFN